MLKCTAAAGPRLIGAAVYTAHVRVSIPSRDTATPIQLRYVSSIDTRIEQISDAAKHAQKISE